MMVYCQLDPKEHIPMKFHWNFKSFHSRTCIWRWRPFCLSLNVLRCVELPLWNILGELSFNILKPQQHGSHIADYIFKCVWCLGICSLAWCLGICWFDLTSLLNYLLIHRGLNKFADILQTSFWNASIWKEILNWNFDNSFTEVYS